MRDPEERLDHKHRLAVEGLHAIMRLRNQIRTSAYFQVGKGTPETHINASGR
jgi:hypothetical protein